MAFLGRVLTPWCEQIKPNTLGRYVEIGGFQGFSRVREMSALDVVAELRTSGLRDRGPTAEPVYRNWQRFLRRHDAGVLVVDATQYDARSESEAFLLNRNPFALVEGLLIASAVCGAEKCFILLPPSLQDLEAVLLNSLEAVQRSGLCQGKHLDLELVRDTSGSIFVNGPESHAGQSALVQNLETWYHLALMFSLGAVRYKTMALEGQTGTYLLTVGGAVKNPGLVEAPLGGDLWTVIETLNGGLAPGSSSSVLALDDGLGGFLPVAKAHLRLAPEEMISAYATPSPTTIWALEKDVCIVEMTRRALYQYWLLSGEETSAARVLIAKATRMVTQVTIGEAQESHLAELSAVGKEMAVRGITAAWPLMSSINHFHDQWVSHVREGQCPSGRCFVREAPPCQRGCPSNIDIPSFLAMIGHREYEEAIRIISMDNPLPYVCGMVCPAPCEGACLRGTMDAPIFIRPMKAVAAKHTLATGGHYPASYTKAEATGRKVAVAGSGPAGLTAAYFLALRGHEVIIFEAQKDAGGMLRYGIPAYRLPREVLDKEVERILRLGVTIKTSYEVQDLGELRTQGFDAIFLALGTQISRMIPIEGKELPFVTGGLDFLKQVRGGEDPKVGPRVVVVGGGNVAIDVALTALRQGAHRVDLVCLENRREMPANSSEIETAHAEGVAIHNSWGPVKVTPDHVFTAQRCTRVFDERGRFSPQFDADTLLNMEADQVILAIGQETDLACVEIGSLVRIDHGLICADPDTMQTAESGVFAGGDVVYGPRTVAEAIKSGKWAAASIDAYLRGSSFDYSGLHPQRRSRVEPLTVGPDARTNLRRPDMPARDVEDRKGNFLHIELGLTDQMALGESSRCLRCDLCIGCGLCQLVCSELGVEALRLGETEAGRLAYTDFTRPSNRCVGCGACSRVCPTGAIKSIDEGGELQTVITGTIVRRQKLLKCRDCGASYTTRAYLDHMKRRVGSDAVAHLDRQICPACARAKRSQELGSWPFFNAV
jgi:NADPH-dependent glutamate synthase beta subunit-like oxidoreductase/NADH:ubiquinone oxidoreductase subunit F (NADH-binding)/formate hydrogenlyase subunit 6/NADH:ubiquinone oxidoreductase subunit I